MESDPQTIGRYRVKRVLGRGSMGVVYEGYDPLLGRTIALKTVRVAFELPEQERKKFERRFLSEARAAAALYHPSIVVVYDIGRDDSGVLFMALEYLRGETVEKIVAGGQPLPWAQALEITRRLAEALHHAHEHGVIHRDVKPANIMVLAWGDPKLMDFGIAKLSTEQLTTTGQVLGTPSYMSPEQALGRKLDPRTDIFSLGSVLHEMLTGTKAFGGPSIPAIVVKLTTEGPLPPTRVNPTLPKQVDALVARALRRNPSERYPDAGALASAIDNLLAAQQTPRSQGR